MVKVNLCVKKPVDFVNYNYVNFDVDTQISNFPQNMKEVISLPRKKKREYKKIAKTFITTAVSFLTLSSRSMAQAKITPLEQTGAMGLPIDFIEPMMTLITLTLASAFVLAMVLMIGAGVLRMLRQTKASVEWTEDIIKGFTQVLIAIPVIFLIYWVAIKTLNISQLFVNPF